MGRGIGRRIGGVFLLGVDSLGLQQVAFAWIQECLRLEHGSTKRGGATLLPVVEPPSRLHPQADTVEGDDDPDRHQEPEEEKKKVTLDCPVNSAPADVYDGTRLDSPVPSGGAGESIMTSTCWSRRPRYFNADNMAAAIPLSSPLSIRRQLSPNGAKLSTSNCVMLT